MLRPGYVPPSRHDVSGNLLNEVHTSLLADCKERLCGKTVSMGIDGWNNIHNEPMMCVSVTTPDGDKFLTETVDSCGHSHTSEYLQSVESSAMLLWMPCV